MGSEFLHDTARRAGEHLQRVAGPGGIADKIAAGEWDDRLTEQQTRDLADRLEALREHARYTRATAEDPTAEPYGPPTAQLPARLRLPLNRKERFYTGTVLPMLIACDGFAYLDRFLTRCGLPAHVSPGRDGTQDVQFFTEYGFAESVFTDDDQRAWPGPVEADTPDLVLAGDGWLLAVEAKMFHNPNAAALNAQMRRQRAVVDTWAERMQIPPERARHLLLLPEPLHQRVRDDLADPVVNWEAVLEDYAAVGPRYWVEVLRTALARHPELESSREVIFRDNADDVLTGADIVEAHGRGKLAPLDHVGLAGGRFGPRFVEDVATGRWRTTRYEVRAGALPENRNWFPLTEFLAATADGGHNPADTADTE